VVGQRKGPSGANAPPVHGIKKCVAKFKQLGMSFYINNCMRKKDLNFTGIGPKKMCFKVILQVFVRKISLRLNFNAV
jgi:hypothetical protein